MLIRVIPWTWVACLLVACGGQSRDSDGDGLLRGGEDARMLFFFEDLWTNTPAVGLYPAFMQVDPQSMTVVREPDHSLLWLPDLLDEVGG